MVKINPIFCRVGTKRPLRDVIFKKFPSNYSTYIEPFVGSGAIFFYNDFDDKKVVLNDLDTRLMGGYKMIKKGVTGDIGKYKNLSMSQLQSIYSGSGGGEMEKLVRIILDCNTFGSTGKGKIYKPASPYNKLKKLDDYKSKLGNATLLNSDYKAVIRRYDNADAFFYLDPPYEESKGLYKHSEFNLEELEKVLSSIKGKFLLSLNDSSNVRKIFSKFKINGIEVETKGKVGIGTGGSRKEVLIKNY